MDEHGEVSYAHAITTLESFGIQEDEAITEFLAHFTIDEDEDEDEEAAGGVDDEWTAAQVRGIIKYFIMSKSCAQHRYARSKHCSRR